MSLPAVSYTQHRAVPARAQLSGGKDRDAAALVLMDGACGRVPAGDCYGGAKKEGESVRESERE